MFLAIRSGPDSSPRALTAGPFLFWTTPPIKLWLRLGVDQLPSGTPHQQVDLHGAHLRRGAAAFFP